MIQILLCHPLFNVSCLGAEIHPYFEQSALVTLKKFRIMMARTTTKCS